MGLREWLSSPGPDTALDLSAGLLPTGGMTYVDPGTYRGLLTLAGYSVSQMPHVVDRQTALSVPALNNGVRIIAALANQLPLRSSADVYETTTFLATLDPDLPRGWTVSKTVQDLVFHGAAYWYVKARWANGYPKAVQWVTPERVKVDTTAGRCWIDSDEVDPDDLKHFAGLTEGILTSGGEAIGTAVANIRQVRRYAENPAPSMYLTDADGAEPLEATDALDYLQAFKDAVTSRGSVYLAGLRLETVGWSARELQLVEARQQDNVAMAQVLGMPAKYLAANEGGSSLTYANLAEVRRDLVDMCLSQWLPVVEARLSMPDMTPRGTTVTFDADSFFLRVTPDQPTPEVAP